MRISDWSSDVCSSDLGFDPEPRAAIFGRDERADQPRRGQFLPEIVDPVARSRAIEEAPPSIGSNDAPHRIDDQRILARDRHETVGHVLVHGRRTSRSEEHTSELQSLMRISYAVFCLKKKKYEKTKNIILQTIKYNNS